jgi:hypothetical protein
MKHSAPNRWEGSLYNAENGKIYSGGVTVVSAEGLRVRGCVLGILCGGEDWTQGDPSRPGRLSRSDSALCARQSNRDRDSGRHDDVLLCTARAILLPARTARDACEHRAWRRFRYVRAPAFRDGQQRRNLFSPDVAWRQRQAEFDKAFPQRDRLTVIVIDGATPERAQEAAVALKRLSTGARTCSPSCAIFRAAIFSPITACCFHPWTMSAIRRSMSSRPSPFWRRSPPTVMRGNHGQLFHHALGVENGETKLDDLARPFMALAGTLEDILAGHPGFFLADSRHRR